MQIFSQAEVDAFNSHRKRIIAIRRFRADVPRTEKWTFGRVSSYRSCRQPCSTAGSTGTAANHKKEAVDSSDERNVVCKLSGWRHEAKRFPRPGVEFERNSIEIGLAVGG